MPRCPCSALQVAGLQRRLEGAGSGSGDASLWEPAAVGLSAADTRLSARAPLTKPPWDHVAETDSDPVLFSLASLVCKGPSEALIMHLGLHHVFRVDSAGSLQGTWCVKPKILCDFP